MDARLIGLLVFGICMSTVCSALDCGSEGARSLRITKGSEAERELSGWQVSIEIGGYLCGGSLIADDLVLTAAHCLHDPQSKREFTKSEARVGHGGLDRSKLQWRGVREIFERTGYSDSALGNDLAIMQLEQPFDLSGAQTPQLVRLNFQPVAAATCSAVTGWGSTTNVAGKPVRSRAERATVSMPLQMASVPVVDRKTCESAYYRFGYDKIATDQICAGYLQGGRDSCQGDSGGPLVAKVGPFYRQIGVVSWGEGCGGENAYGVYTSVAAHRDWIESIMARER